MACPKERSGFLCNSVSGGEHCQHHLYRRHMLLIGEHLDGAELQMPLPRTSSLAAEWMFRHTHDGQPFHRQGARRVPVELDVKQLPVPREQVRSSKCGISSSRTSC